MDSRDAFIVFLFVIVLLLVGALIWYFGCREWFGEETDKDPMLMELQALLIQVHPKAEHINLRKAGKSYTVNKSDMYLCLRDEAGEYFNKNMLIYVGIHELAHVVCKSIGHTEEFHAIFDELLNEAIKKGIYNPSIPVVGDYQDRCRL